MPYQAAHTAEVLSLDWYVELSKMAARIEAVPICATELFDLFSEDCQTPIVTIAASSSDNPFGLYWSPQREVFAVYDSRRYFTRPYVITKTDDLYRKHALTGIDFPAIIMAFLEMEEEDPKAAA